MATYLELQAKISSLQREAELVRRSEVAAAVKEIREKMSTYGLTVDDLESHHRAHLKGQKVPAKYRHPKTKQTWSGRGKYPRWLAAEIAAGKRPEDFSIV